MNRLQRTAFILSCLAASFAGSLAVSLFTGRAEASQEKETVVKAQGFELVDKNGKKRASLTLDQDARPMMRFLDGDGNVRGVMRMDKDGNASLNFYDKDDKWLLWLGENNTGTGLGLAPPTDEKNRINVYVTKDEKGLIECLDKEGVRRATLTTAADGSPSLTLTDDKGAKVWGGP